MIIFMVATAMFMITLAIRVNRLEQKIDKLMLK